MKITYYVHVKAIIIFDGCLRYTEMNDNTHPLQDYFDKAEWFMGEYGFAHAEIIDDDDGTTIAEMTREESCDDDDGPAFYDDGTVCGYE